MHQLWKSDGTPANTVLVKDSLITTNIGNPVNLRGEINGNVIFTREVNGSTTSSTITELWKTDGTTAGTSMYVSLTHTSGTNSGGALRNFTVAGNLLFFSMAQSNGRELWVTDGTAAGTMEVIDLCPGTVSNIPAPGVKDQPMIAYNNKLYFTGNTTPANTELFCSDGTAAGTTLAAEINPLTTMAGGSDPEKYIIYNNELYFFADDGTSNSSNGLWKTDGTTTTKVFQNLLGNGQPTLFQNMLYFANGNDLYKTDGTTAGTALVNSTAVTNILGANSTYLFSVYMQYTSSPPYYINTYWRTDGTNNTQVPYDLANSASFLLLNDKMYISRLDSGSYTVMGLWETDGTQAGTSKIWNNGPGLHKFNNTFFFSHYDASTGAGIELWSFAPGNVTTSAQEMSSDNGVKLYPNPSNGIFNIDCGDKQASLLKVYDLSGREVYSKAVTEKIMTVDMGELAAGAYLYRIMMSDDTVLSGRLLLAE